MENVFSTRLSLTSLSNEILINFIFSRENLTINDLFHLMLSCRQLHNIIVDSNQLWMCKFSERWPLIHCQIQDKKNVNWMNWVSLRLRIVKEVKEAVTSLSSQCYPLGELVNPLHAVGKWFEDGYPTPNFVEDELCNLVWDDEMSEHLTLTHYANVLLERVRTCMHERDLKMFMAKPQTQNTYLEGAKLISKWFHFSSDFEVNLSELLDVEQSLQNIAERVEVLVKERKSNSLQIILKCIDEVLFEEMVLSVYFENDDEDLNHVSASIHNVLETFVGYPEILAVIYLEVAARVGITCEPICVDHFNTYTERLLLRCRGENELDVHYVDVCSGGLIDSPSIDPTAIDRPAISFNHLFRHLMDEVIILDEMCYYESFSSDDLWNLRISSRLGCILWPEETSYYAELCLKDYQQVDDAHQMLLSAGVDNEDPVMLDCIIALSSQNAEIDAAKVARHRSPSIKYAVGLVMNFNGRNGGVIPCVIVSWDLSFRVLSRKKWGLWWKPILEGYNLAQPFYHVVLNDDIDDDFENHLYVPQEALELHPAVDDQSEMPYNPDLDIYFESFDGRRYVPNAEHKAHFPEDDAVALSLIG